MNSPRPKPYIWVSWLTSLLAETDKCQWKVWFKSHYRYEKVPSDGGFDLKEWQRQHDAMTTNRVERLKLQGYTVKVEDENAFKLDGKTVTIAGKPDIVAIRESEKRALVIDEKSGRQRDSDRWQVYVYILAMSRTKLKGYTIDGEVEYRGTSEHIPADDYTPEVEEKIFSLARVVGGTVAPPYAPSPSECRFCDIASCPKRWKSEEVTVVVEEF